MSSVTGPRIALVAGGGVTGGGIPLGDICGRPRQEAAPVPGGRCVRVEGRRGGTDGGEAEAVLTNGSRTGATSLSVGVMGVTSRGREGIG